MNNHPHQFNVKNKYGFQGILAFVVVALVSLAGYTYLTGSHASGSYIGVAVSPSGSVFKLDSGGCVNGGSTSICNTRLNAPVSGIASYNGNNTGYWITAQDGGVFAYGGAPFNGSMAGKSLAQPVRAVAGRGNSGGYWLLGGDGGVFSFNGAQFYGGGNQRVAGATDFIAIASTPSGNGYWLAEKNGNIWPFGDAAGGHVSVGATVTGLAGGYGGDNGVWAVHSTGAVTRVGNVGALAGNLVNGTVGIARAGNNSYDCVWGITTGAATEQCATPTVDAFTASPSTIAYNGGSNLSWSSSFASGCSISGIGAVAYSGSHGTGNLTSSKSYTITCSNPTRTSASRSVVVNVGAAPGPTTNPSSPPPSSGTPPTSGGTHSSSGSRSSGGSVATPDKTPPTIPGNFTATLNSQVVDLTWNASTDNVAVDHYELDRSLDQTVWTSISSSVSSTSYTDTSVGYGATYYYRVRALDGAANASDYATAQVTTGAFTANSTADNDTTITSDDKIVTVTIPSGAFSDDAQCSVLVDADNASGLPLKKSALITGPYSLLCKKQDGSNITNFSTPISVSVKLTADQNKRYHDFTFYSFNNGKWAKFKITYNKKTANYTFNTNQAFQFAVLGSVKKGLSAQVIILIIMFILLIAGAAYFLYQRGQKQNYQEYIRKKYYNL